MDPIKLRELASSELDEARKIQEKAESEQRTMTQEEMNSYNTHVNKAEEYANQADRKERFNKLDERMQKPQDRKSQPEISTGFEGKKIETKGVKLYRHGNLKAFKGPDANINAYRAGRFLMASIFDHAESRQWCREHGVELRVQTEGINSAGGYLVPDEMEQSIIDLREQYGMFRQNAFVMPMSSDHMNIPRRTSGVTAYFVGETDATTASQMAFSQVELTAKELAALTLVSASVSEDAVISIADIITNDMAWQFAKKEDECGIDGDGTSTYGGMTGIRTKFVDGNHTAGRDAGTSPCTAWSHLTIAGEITNIMSLLPAYALPNAKWYISQAGKAGGLDALALAGGGNTTITLADGAIEQKAFGYPVVVSAAMPSAPTNGTVYVLFGDLSLAATFGDRRGITVAQSRERYFEYRQIAIQATERFCINIHDIGDTSTAGPIVAGVGTT